MNFECDCICDSYDSSHILLKVILVLTFIMHRLYVKKYLLSIQTLCSQNPNIWKTRHAIMSIFTTPLFYKRPTLDLKGDFSLVWKDTIFWRLHRYCQRQTWEPNYQTVKLMFFSVGDPVGNLKNSQLIYYFKIPSVSVWRRMIA